jgi:hypothetical protein
MLGFGRWDDFGCFVESVFGCGFLRRRGSKLSSFKVMKSIYHL